MANTGRLVVLLADAVRDSAGAVIASGRARFFNPGTLVAANVYSDDACLNAVTQPYVLSAGGAAQLYALAPVRVRVHDSTDTTLKFDAVDITRAEQVYITSTKFNAGVETTTKAALELLATSLGNEGLYKESSGATARTYTSRLKEDHVSVVDFGADTTGVADAGTAITAAIAEVAAQGGGWVYFPAGTYLISAAINVTTAGVKLCGDGRAVSIIKNSSAAANAITFTFAANADTKCIVRELGVIASTTSSGTGIKVITGGDRLLVDNCSVALHRTGIDVSAGNANKVVDCVIVSTDDNAAAIGIKVGVRGLVEDCEVISGTLNGTGVSLSGDYSAARGGYVTKFATGISVAGSSASAEDVHVELSTTGITLSGTNNARVSRGFVSCATGGTGVSVTASFARVSGLYVTATAAAASTGIAVSGQANMISDCYSAIVATGFTATDSFNTFLHCSANTCTTGINVGAIATRVDKCYVATSTTGIAVGAFARCQVTNNVLSANTTDITVNASATTLVEHGNDYSTITDTAGRGHSWLKDRAKVSRRIKATSSSTTPTFTPTPELCDFHVFESTSAAAAAVTVAATATTGLVDGQDLRLIFWRNAAANDLTAAAFNAQYVTLGIGNVTPFDYITLHFQWNSSASTWNEISTRGLVLLAAGTAW